MNEPFAPVLKELFCSKRHNSKNPFPFALHGTLLLQTLMKMRQGPAFIGIGASHAGLSQVTKWLCEHEAIADSVPAGNFFNTEAFTKKGLDWYEDRIGCGRQSKGQLCGDVTAGYLVHKDVPQRIATSYSDTKLFLIVRHPLKRALQAYIANQTIDKSASNLSAAAYLAKETAIQMESCYADHLAYYYEYYAPVNLHIIIYEDLLADPIKVMQSLYAYLEIDTQVIPKGLKHLAPPPEPPKNPGLIKRTRMRIKKLYKRLRERPVGPLFSPEPDMDRLLSPEEKELFIARPRPAADRLSHMVGRDMLSFWELS